MEDETSIRPFALRAHGWKAECVWVTGARRINFSTQGSCETSLKVVEERGAAGEERGVSR